MYGKAFESIFTGSMMGGGALKFAVWLYVISHQKPRGGPSGRDRFEVEINAGIVAFLIGEKKEEVEAVLQEFCEPDAASRTPDKEGRKLVKVGEYLYEVVNGAKYDRMKRDWDRREATRKRVAKWRAKGKPLKGEAEYVEAVGREASQEELNAILEKYAGERNGGA